MKTLELNEMEMNMVNGGNGGFEDLNFFFAFCSALESGDYVRAREYYYDLLEAGADENTLYTYREFYKLYTGEELH